MNNKSLARWVLLVAAGLLMSSVHAAWEINLPNGRFTASVKDMEVKVLGGHVKVARLYDGEAWKINPAWAPLVIESLDHSIGCSGAADTVSSAAPTAHYDICQIKRNGAEFKLDVSGQALVLKSTSRYALRPLWIAGSQNKTLRNIAADDGTDLNSRVAGFRWEDRVTGEWIEYNNKGLIQRYGDRNDVVVTFQHNAAQQLVAVKDHHGRQVLVYEYDAENRIVAVKDQPISGDPLPQRTVRYTYTDIGDGNPATLVRHDISTVTDVRGRLTAYTYNNKNKIIKTKSAEEKEVVITYGSAGKVSAVTEADGSKTTYDYTYDKLKKEFGIVKVYPLTAEGRVRQEIQYSNEGRLLWWSLQGKRQQTYDYELDAYDQLRKTMITDGLGRKTVQEKDEFENITKTTYPDGVSVSAKYSAITGLLESVTDEMGVITNYEYDLKGNVARKVSAVGKPEQQITTYGHDDDGQVLSRTRQGGAVTLPNGSVVSVADATIEYEYDETGNVKLLRNAENNTQSMSHNRMGQVVSLTDANSHTWLHDFDAKGSLLSDTDPLGHAYAYGYNKVGKLERITDPEQHETAYTHDVMGNVTGITDAIGNSATLTYDVLRRVRQANDTAGKKILGLNYSSDNLLESVDDGLANRTQFQYDDARQLIGSALPTYSLGMEYDARGRAHRVVQTLDANTIYSRSTGYDAAGQAISRTDSNNKVSTRSFDALGRHIDSTDVLGGVTRYTYDTRNNLLAVTDPAGNTTTYTYDKANRLLTETRPEGQQQHFDYDAKGQLISMIDAKGQRIAYTLDAADRRTLTRVYNAASDLTRSITYSYNAANALVGYDDVPQSSASVRITATYTLDALYRRTQETVQYGTKSFTTQRTYNANGGLASLIYPDGYMVQHAYDAGLNLQTITLPEGPISYQNRLWQAPQNILFPGGSKLQLGYDSLQRLVSQSASNTGQQQLLSRQYQYDGESNLLRRDTESDSYEYRYDAGYRLTGVETNSDLDDEAYTYDRLDNRLTDSRRGGAQAWQFDRNNALKTSYTRNGTALTLSYDANGSVTSRQSSDATSPLNNQHYTYDEVNRLSEVRNSNNVLIARYQYDPQGRRISKTVFNDLGQGTTTWFVYGPEGLLAEANDSGQISTEYGWQPGALWNTAPVFIRTSLLSAAPESPLQPYFIINDAIGTPQKIIDQSGQVVWAQSAYSFGEQVINPQLIRNPLRMAGQYADDETGLYYNYHRSYDPTIGRYLESDPIGLDGGLNTYAYVGARPLSGVDPLGLTLALAAPVASGGGGLLGGVTAASMAATGAAVAAGLGLGYGICRALGTCSPIQFPWEDPPASPPPSTANPPGSIAPPKPDSCPADGPTPLPSSPPLLNAPAPDEETDPAPAPAPAPEAVPARDVDQPHPADPNPNRNPRQDKRLNERGQEIDRLKESGNDPHDLKNYDATKDLFKDRKGNVYIKPKSGAGYGEPTGINLNEI